MGVFEQELEGDKQTIFILSNIIDKLIACINPEKMAEYETKKIESSMRLMDMIQKRIKQEEKEDGR